LVIHQSHCNGLLPSFSHISPSKKAFETAPLEAVAMVIPIDIMRVLSNHYSKLNPRAIAMVNQWRHWKPLQRLHTAKNIQKTKITHQSTKVATIRIPF